MRVLGLNMTTTNGVLRIILRSVRLLKTLCTVLGDLKLMGTGLESGIARDSQSTRAQQKLMLSKATFCFRCFSLKMYIIIKTNFS